MEIITLREDYIKLGQALKAAALVEDGVEAKLVIKDGEVTVNGEVDTRRGRKLYDGDVVCYNGNEIQIKKIRLKKLKLIFHGRVLMYIKSLELKNYRNYESLCINISPGTNILYGDNAQGKTNILEALYLAGTTKSHRGSKDREIIQFDREEAHIRMMVERNGSTHKIDMHLKKNKSKGIAIDGVPIRKASELFGIVNIVFFSPEDLNIIKNGPAERRRFLDSEICQLSRLYMIELANYNKVVAQRNKLLKRDFVFRQNGGYARDLG